jgi:hypothetical protein
LGKLRPEALGLPDEDTKVGAPPEYLIGLPEKGARRGEVEQREVAPRELDPRL